MNANPIELSNSKSVVGLKQASNASVHLDAIRGVAALLVFLGHGRGLFLQSGFRDALVGKAVISSPGAAATASTSAPVSVPVDAHETIGHEAVIVFFVLSGYFVGGSVLRAARKGVFSWRTYLFQRLTRLWIVLLPALLIGWALDVGGMHLLANPHNIYSGPPGQEDVAPGLASRLTPSVFLGNLLFLQGIATQTFGTNVSLWSLSYEFWYYLFFPFLVIVFLPSKRLPVRILAVLPLLAMSVLCGLEISRYFVVWLFGAGVALLPLKLSPRHLKKSILAAGLIFLLALVGMLRSRLDLYFSDLLLSTLFSALLWIILHSTRSTSGGLYRTLAQGLSNMSYTLYLAHMPFFVILSALLMPVWHGWSLSARTALLLAGVYAAVFAIAWLMYYCFERNTERVRAWLIANKRMVRSSRDASRSVHVHAAR